MIITFGKHTGKDTNLLAKSPDGREYLRWGAQNLKSNTWRVEFDRALSDVKLGTLEEQAGATCRIDSSADYDDVLRFLQSEADTAAEDDAMFAAIEKAQSVIFDDWAKTSGKSIGQLQAIYRRFETHSAEELNLLPLSSFSSPSAKEQFIKNIIALNACYR